MRYLLIVIIFIIGFSALPVWAMDCYAEHEGGNTVVIGYVPRISIPSNGAVTEGALDDEKEANCEKRLNSVAVPSL